MSILIDVNIEDNFNKQSETLISTHLEAQNGPLGPIFYTPKK